MLEKINEKLEKETNKILGKEDLSIEEIKFLTEERSRLLLERCSKTSEEDMKQLIELMFKNQFPINP